MRRFGPFIACLMGIMTIMVCCGLNVHVSDYNFKKAAEAFYEEEAVINYILNFSTKINRISRNKSSIASIVKRNKNQSLWKIQTKSKNSFGFQPESRVLHLQLYALN